MLRTNNINSDIYHNELESVIKNLKSGKESDPDNINSNIIKIIY